MIMIRLQMKNYYLNKDGSVSMHHKESAKICPENMSEVFQFQIQNHHNLRNIFTFKIPSFNKILEGKESISHLGPKICNHVPYKIKSLEFLTF